MDYDTVYKIVKKLSNDGRVIAAEQTLVAARECGLPHSKCNRIAETFQLALFWVEPD